MMKIIILSGMANQSVNCLSAGEAVGTVHFVSKPLINFVLDALQEKLKPLCFQVLSESSVIDALINKSAAYLDWGTLLQPYVAVDKHDPEELLWIRDDVLYDVDFECILSECRQASTESMVFLVDNNPVIFYQNNQQRRDLPGYFSEQSSTADFCQLLRRAFSWQTANIKTGAAYMIDSVDAYHHLSMRLLNNEMKHIVLDPHQLGESLVRGMRVSVDTSSQQQTQAYLGDAVYVHSDSQLHDQVILCKGCYVDDFVDISNSIVMPDVYVGSYLNVTNAVITGNAVIRVDTGSVLPILDENMISNMARV